jgi:hypothetical protein
MNVDRRTERTIAAYIAAVGEPSVFAPIVSPWVRAALEKRLPAKELTR